MSARSVLAAIVLVALGTPRSPASSQVPARSSAATDARVRALAGWDDETGIWFPSPDLKGAYLARDPKHPLVEELRKAFERDPALLAAVRELVEDPARAPKSAQPSGSTRQLKSMFDGVVLGLSGRAAEGERRSRLASETEETYRRWIDREAADRLAVDERERRMAALNGEFDSLSREKRLAAAFRQLGLSPAGELAVFRILGNDPFPSAAGESPFHLSVRRVLEREAARPAAGPPQYEMALRNLDLYEGKYAQAIARSRKILAGRGEDELPGNRFLLALLLKVTGEPAPLAGWLQRCSANEAPTPETVGRPRGATCRDTAFWVSWRCVKLLERKAPRAFGDVFVEFARAEPANWPMRCETIRLLRYVDPARCAKESERLLATPAGEAPIGARLDAMTELVNVAADRKDHATALAWCDRYLSLLQFRSPAAPPDLWGKLAALPGDETDAGTPWTWDESPSDVTWMLAKKVKIALDARDGPAARRFLVDYLSTVFQLLEEANSYCSLFDPSKAPPEERAALEIYIASTSRELAGLYRREARLGRGYLERIAALENDLAQSLRNQ